MVSDMDAMFSCFLNLCDVRMRKSITCIVPLKWKSVSGGSFIRGKSVKKEIYHILLFEHRKPNSSYYMFAILGWIYIIQMFKMQFLEPTQYTQDVDPMFYQRWSTGCEGGSTLNQH